MDKTERTPNIMSEVERMPIEGNVITKYTMKMMSLNELWLIPDLVGKKLEIKAANQERYLYLKDLDARLKFHIDEKDKEEIIRNAIRNLNTVREASHWFRYRRAFKNVEKVKQK